VVLDDDQGELFSTPTQLRDELAFKSWLESAVGLRQRSASDVVSRVKRAMALADVLGAASDHELRFRLEESSAYRDCSSSVRSQLKRAAQLYRQFRRPLEDRQP